MKTAASAIAEAFVKARRTWQSLGEYPGERPDDLASAYAIQDQALSLWDRRVGGWKVGKINPPVSDALGADRLIGPVFSDTIKAGKAPHQEFRIFDGGFAAIEAEFMLRLAPRPGALPENRHQAMDWVDDIRIGMEIASSPYAGINDDGPCVTISDHGNNAGLLLGAPVPTHLWATLDDVEVSLSIDGQEAGRATTATMLDGPFGAVAFLLRNLAQRGIDPQAGWWVSSGAITGVHPIGAGQHAVGRFEGIGDVEARILPVD